MSFKALIVSFPMFWACTTAMPAPPAGPGVWPNGTSPAADFSVLDAYSLIDTYDGTNWLSKFTVQNIADPTHGFVNYVDEQNAQNLGLLKMQGSQVYMGVDSTTVLNPNGPGRNSVRVQSNTAYTHGLVIADFAHIPGSNCGSWPAFWMVGPNWPNDGELDIIEGVNLNTYDQITLHSSPGCTVTVGDGGQIGSSVDNADCGAGGGYNGCGVVSSSATSYGTAFDAAAGGVYASLWTSSGIKVWTWNSGSVPGDITSENPNPNGWGTPTANFAGCDFDAHFMNMNIVFDITFCGDWAGQVWGSSTCAQSNPSCNAYVASEPQSFADSYWLVNSIKVYSV